MIYFKKCSCFSLCFTMLIFKIKIKGITSISSEKCFNNIIIFFLKMLKICVSWATLNGGKRERGWPYLWRQIEHLFYFCYVYLNLFLSKLELSESCILFMILHLIVQYWKYLILIMYCWSLFFWPPPYDACPLRNTLCNTSQ